MKEWLKNQIIENTNYAHEEGEDKLEITEWTWPGKQTSASKESTTIRKAA